MRRKASSRLFKSVLFALCLLALAVPTALLWPATFWAEWLMRWLDRREASGRAADPRGSEMQLEFVAPEAAATARHDGTPAAHVQCVTLQPGCSDSHRARNGRPAARQLSTPTSWRSQCWASVHAENASV